MRDRFYPPFFAAFMTGAALLTGCAARVVVTEGARPQETLMGGPIPIGAKPIDLTACVDSEVQGFTKEQRIQYREELLSRTGYLFEEAALCTAPGDYDLRVTVDGYERYRVYLASNGKPLLVVGRGFGEPGDVDARKLGEVYRRIQPGGAIYAAAMEDRVRRQAAPRRRPPQPEPSVPPSPRRVERVAGLELPRYHERQKPDAFAIVVGVEKYSDLPDAAFAERDAEAVRAHMEALGVPARNVILLKGSRAVRTSLDKYIEDWLPKVVKPDSRVYFYFSGHGAPDPTSGEAFLVPWDGDPNFLTRTAYPLKRLYQKLGELKAREVVVALDTCFSGAGGRSVLPSGARPLVVEVVAPPVGRLTVLAASAAREISGALPDRAHGAFTYFLLRGLNEGKSTAQELYDYLLPRVQDEARRLNREQTPQLIGVKELILR